MWVTQGFPKGVSSTLQGCFVFGQVLKLQVVDVNTIQ